MIKPTKDIPEKSEIEIVATKKTQSLSKKSTITYHVCKDDDDTLYLRLWVNSSNGFFSNELIPMSKIEEILKHQSNSFTSYVFKDLFNGKSVNSHGFISVCLIAEGILAFEEGKKRKLVYTGKGLTLDKAKSRKTVKKAAAKPARKPSK